jgi:hypothetical protein
MVEWIAVMHRQPGKRQEMRGFDAERNESLLLDGVPSMAASTSAGSVSKSAAIRILPRSAPG